jgi:uncharacterized protein (DUF1778 family)
MATTTDPKPARLNLRLSSSSDELIREAAAVLGKSVTDYVTESAIDRAREVLADQRHFALDETTWNAFTAALDSPPRFNQRLAALFNLPPLIEGD